jgi:DNA-binding Lrp family transcriptional regulator
MSVRIMSKVFDNQTLTPTQKLVMLALADHANDEGKSIYPSQSTVSRKTGLARGTVNRHVKELIDNGYLRAVGYKSERSNVKELEIVVSKLGVTESDTSKSNGKSQQVSQRMTTGVTEDDTNHQLTINKTSLKDSQPAADPEYIPAGHEFDEPEPPPKKTKGEKHKEMVQALMDATELDMKIKLNAGRIYKASKELRDAGYTPDDVKAFMRTWPRDWRYQKDLKPPAISVIQAEIKKGRTDDDVLERKLAAERQIAEAMQS